MLERLTQLRIREALDALHLKHFSKDPDSHEAVFFAGDDDKGELRLFLAAVGSEILSVVAFFPTTQTAHIPADCLVWFANLWNSENRWPTAVVVTDPDGTTLHGSASVPLTEGVSTRQLVEMIRMLIAGCTQLREDLHEFASATHWTADGALGDLFTGDGQ